MSLPRKITPSNLKEAVVEIRYISRLPFEVLIGIFYKALANDYTYSNRPIKPMPVRQPIPAKMGQEITIRIGNLSLFYNDKISIQLAEQSIVFTSLDEYIGWKEYKPELEKALTKLYSTKTIMQCIRVGLRYISEYENKNLKDCIKFSFSFGLPQVESETTGFHSEFMYNNSKIVLNLSNKVPFIKQQSSGNQAEIITTSIVDIDVISDNLTLTSLEELLKAIEENHTKEKEIYFSMLQPDYLESLNPEY
ncbi:MAG: TIGR04255 family protein [Flavisolibacter sp.]|jgi:uncharacterized protein (TIGR04255 family)|nr:TIGR04255 family protein [Flavisolibacter sp.]